MAKRGKRYGYLKPSGKYEVAVGREHVSFHRKLEAAVRKACRVGGSVYRDLGVAGMVKETINCPQRRR